MFADPHSHDAVEIIRAMSTLPGGLSIHVTAKRYPRRCPAEPSSHYQQQENDFDLRALPPDLPIPDGMDEIALTIEGVLDDEQSTLDLLTCVNGVLGSAHTNLSWDARTFLGNPQNHPRPYKVDVFCDLFGG